MSDTVNNVKRAMLSPFPSSPHGQRAPRLHGHMIQPQPIVEAMRARGQRMFGSPSDSVQGAMMIPTYGSWPISSRSVVFDPPGIHPTISETEVGQEPSLL